MSPTLFAAFLTIAPLQAAAAPPPKDAAVTPADAAAKAAADAKAEAEAKFVCRLETATGSRFAKKVCRRKEDFDRKTQEDREGLRQKQMTGGLFR
jgi:hypothetical protein